ncbi:hypothetical protein DID80_04850 [Candidatus Marinamargulisbacteria bacterium SCGC AAA071-K20]|nr:hypothetical protein DID80_04850 [Candidatus Marinamargulisbacteria bacterium SCGC AAA071-K20]
MNYPVRLTEAYFVALPIQPQIVSDNTLYPKLFCWYNYNMQNEIITSDSKTLLKKEDLFDHLKNLSEESTWALNYKNANTKKTYMNAIKEFCDLLGIQSKDRLREIVPAHAIAFRDSLITRKQAPKTINCKMSALSSLFQNLMSQQIVSVNPFSGVERMKEEYTSTKSLDLDIGSVRHMLSAMDTTTLKGIRDKAIMNIFFFVGCRVGEVCRLRVKDCYTHKGHYYLDLKLKGGKRNRVPIPAHVKHYIDEYLEHMEHKEIEDAPLFLAINKGRSVDPLAPISDRALRYIWKNYRVDETSSPHCARSTFGTRAFELGAELKEVQEYMGHVDPKTTQLYDHSSKDPSRAPSYLMRY